MLRSLRGTSKDWVTTRGYCRKRVKCCVYSSFEGLDTKARQRVWGRCCVAYLRSHLRVWPGLGGSRRVRAGQGKVKVCCVVQ